MIAPGSNPAGLRCCQVDELDQDILKALLRRAATVSQGGELSLPSTFDTHIDDEPLERPSERSTDGAQPRKSEVESDAAATDIMFFDTSIPTLSTKPKKGKSAEPKKTKKKAKADKPAKKKTLGRLWVDSGRSPSKFAAKLVGFSKAEAQQRIGTVVRRDTEGGRAMVHDACCFCASVFGGNSGRSDEGCKPNAARWREHRKRCAGGKP